MSYESTWCRDWRYQVLIPYELTKCRRCHRARSNDLLRVRLVGDGAWFDGGKCTSRFRRYAGRYSVLMSYESTWRRDWRYQVLILYELTKCRR